MSPAIDRAFDACARWLSRASVCLAFIAIMPVGLVYGWVEGWSQGYLLAFNLYLSTVPYVVMFVLLYTSARDTLANQVQQGELIRAIPGARNELIGLETKSADEIAALKEQQ